MRQMISGLVAALALIVAGAAPARACDGGCSPCAYVSPCGAIYERLPDPEVQYHSGIAPPQYYYVEQGPTYTGSGDFAPRRVYREEGVTAWGYHHHHAYRHHHHWHHYEHVLHSYY